MEELVFDIDGIPENENLEQQVERLKGEQAIAKEKIEDLTFQVESLHKRLDEFNKLLECQRCTNCIKLEKIIVQYREKVLQIEMLKLDNILEKLNNK